MNEQIIKDLKFLGEYIEHLDKDTVADYLENHVDEKQSILDAINQLEMLLTWA